MIEAALLRRWTQAWAVSRGLAAPREQGPALHLHVGAPDQHERLVFPHAPSGIAEIAAGITEPLILLKAPLEPGPVCRLLPPGWSVERTGHVMTQRTLPAARPSLPSGYRLLVTDLGAVVQAMVVDRTGGWVARGRLVVIDELAVHDRVRTAPAHERRGLGAAVMAALGCEGARRGARSGMLTATAAGRALYTKLGWETRAPWTTAQLIASPASFPYSRR